MTNKSYLVVSFLLLNSCTVVPCILSDSERIAVDLLNSRRNVAGKPSLEPSRKLFTACREYAPLLHNKFGHSVDGSSPHSRAYTCGYWLGVGEVLARDVSLEEGFASLLNSPPHKRAMLDAYRDVGVAVSERDGVFVLVYLLGHKKILVDKNGSN